MNLAMHDVYDLLKILILIQKKILVNIPAMTSNNTVYIYIMKKPIQMFALKVNLSSHYTVFVSASLINLCFTLSVTAQFMGYWCAEMITVVITVYVTRAKNGIAYLR